MVKITTIRINTLYIKIIFMLLFFVCVLFSLKSMIFSNDYVNMTIKSINADYFARIIQSVISLNKTNYTHNTRLLAQAVNDISECIIGFDIKKPETVIGAQLQFLNYNKNNEDLATISESAILLDNSNEFSNNLDKENTEINYEPEVKPKEDVIKSKGITLINETNYSIDLNSFINSPIKIMQKENQPQVLIYHTHTCESYAPSEKYRYIPSDNDRTNDLRFTVVRVGEEITKILGEQYGIRVIHDRTIHDRDEYSSSYTKSAETLQKYLNKYPNISLIIDIHRDAASINGRKLRVSTTIGGNLSAKVMTIIGTDGRGLPHPNWRENLKLGVKFTNKMNELYPGLSRGINLKLGRFNQYLSSNAILIEVGGNGNTLDEALNSAPHISRVIAELLTTK